MLVRSLWLHGARIPFASPVRQKQLVRRVARGFATSHLAADPKAISFYHGNIVCGTVTTAKPSKSTLAQLIETIPRPSLDVDNLSPKASLILLLTPSFAQHARNAQVPLDLHTRLTPPSSHPVLPILDTSTAIVDRLASPDASGSGNEGLSFVYARHPAAVTVLHESPHKPSAQLPGSLSFVLPHLRHRSGAGTIQLPLAQTTFSTGLVSTLVGRRYQGLDLGLTLEQEQLLNTQVLRLPFGNAFVNVSVPLLPLTPFRTIHNHLGNIVRTLSSSTATSALHGSAGPQGSQTASEELEVAVNRYFKALKLPPQPVSVWALTIPNPGPQAMSLQQYELCNLSSEQLAHLWSSSGAERDFVNGDINRLLQSGARLCKVLSGGGGWGKKAGLLSLDPDTSYTGRELRVDEGWEFDFDDDSPDALKKQQRQALGEVVSSGDYIMFLIAPRDEDTVASAPTQPWYHLTDSGRIAVFGTVPSTVDELPEINRSGEVARADLDGSADVYTPNLFGALSEGGMALSFVPEGKMQHATQTKLDVPHARITVSQPGWELEQSDSTTLSFSRSTEAGVVGHQVRQKETFRGRYPSPRTGNLRGYSTTTVRAHDYAATVANTLIHRRKLSHIGRQQRSSEKPTQSATHDGVPPQVDGSQSYRPYVKRNDKKMVFRKVTRSTPVRRVPLSAVTEYESTKREARTSVLQAQSINVQHRLQVENSIPKTRHIFPDGLQVWLSTVPDGTAKPPQQPSDDGSVPMRRRSVQDPPQKRQLSTFGETATKQRKLQSNRSSNTVRIRHIPIDFPLVRKVEAPPTTTNTQSLVNESKTRNLQAAYRNCLAKRREGAHAQASGEMKESLWDVAECQELNQENSKGRNVRDGQRVAEGVSQILNQMYK